MRSLFHKYHIAPIFGLLLVLIFFYFPVLFLGRTLQGPEMARMNVNLKSPPSPKSILGVHVAPQIFNTEQTTAAYGYYPFDIYQGQSYRSFHIPLWNPHQGIGSPFAAQYETSSFFPLRILQVLFPTGARDFFFVLHMWLAGIFTYLFFTEIKLNRISAFWGAALYMGSGVFSWYMQLQVYMAVSMMLPLVMLATFLVSNALSYKRISFLGLTTGFLLLAGQPEAIFYALLLSGSYYLFRLVSLDSLRSNKIKNLMGYSAGNLLGFLIAAPLLLLFIELCRLSFGINTLGVQNLDHIIGISGRTSLYQLSYILFPKMLDLPVMPLIVPDTVTWDFIGAYLGIVPLFFLISGCFLKDENHKKDFLFFLFFGIGFILMDLGVWPFGWLGYLPLFSQSWSPRWGGTAWSFALVTASTYAFNFIQYVNLSDKEWQKLLNKTLLLVIAVVYIGFAGDFRYPISYCVFFVDNFIYPELLLVVNYVFGIACILMIYYILRYYRFDKRCFSSCVLILIVSLWYWLSKGDILTPGVLGQLSAYHNNVVTKLISLSIALFFLASIFLYLNRKTKLFLLCSIFIFIVSIIQNMIVFPGYPKRQSVEKVTPFISYLQNKAGYQRIFALNGILMPSYASIYKLYDIRFITALSVLPYQNFVEQYVKEQKNYNYKSWFDANYFLSKPLIKNDTFIVKFQPDFLKAISFLGVKYIITQYKKNHTWMAEHYPLWGSALKTVYQDRYVNIYENTAVFKRVFLVSHFRIEDGYLKAQAAAMDQQFNMLDTAVLEAPVVLPENDSTRLKGTANIISYDENKVEISVTTNKSTLLILTDLYYPGWQVTIDHHLAKIVRVDGLVRGVFVPTGKHMVVFYYAPFLFKIGLICFFIALAICLVFLFL